MLTHVYTLLHCMSSLMCICCTHVYMLTLMYIYCTHMYMLLCICIHARSCVHAVTLYELTHVHTHCDMCMCSGAHAYVLTRVDALCSRVHAHSCVCTPCTHACVPVHACTCSLVCAHTLCTRVRAHSCVCVLWSFGVNCHFFSIFWSSGNSLKPSPCWHFPHSRFAQPVLR